LERTFEITSATLNGSYRLWYRLDRPGFTERRAFHGTDGRMPVQGSELPDR
jgi:hypothetical protein